MPRADEYQPERRFVPFRFTVKLADEGGKVICGGSFSEATGLEATMTPRVIREGGRNWSAVQRAGPVAFGTVILKRGMTAGDDLSKWFDLTTRLGGYGVRLNGTIEVVDRAAFNTTTKVATPHTLLTWTLHNAMPIKFKGADLNAAASQVAVEELHLVHEGLTLKRSED